MLHVIKKIMIPFILMPGILKNTGDWMFEYTSRVVELFNTWCLVGFGVIMLGNSSYLLKINIYDNFVKVPYMVWVFMIGLGILQFWLLCKSCNNSNQFGGILLQFSAIIWLVIAMAFALQPPISTALPIYTGLSFVFGVTGYGVLRTSKEQEE